MSEPKLCAFCEKYYLDPCGEDRKASCENYRWRIAQPAPPAAKKSGKKTAKRGR